jgi:hypothetical protein
MYDVGQSVVPWWGFPPPLLHKSVRTLEVVFWSAAFWYLYLSGSQLCLRALVRTRGEVLYGRCGRPVMVQELGRRNDERPSVWQVCLSAQGMEVLRRRGWHHDEHVGVPLCLPPDELYHEGLPGGCRQLLCGSQAQLSPEG